MEHRIEILSEKKLVGMRMVMSFSHNRTVDLWKGFMPRRSEIENTIGTDLFSIQLYPSLFFNHFNPEVTFEKRAAIEVSNFDFIPEGMEPFVLSGGLYAVFLYKGTPESASETFKYILGVWMSDSEYLLDTRPHFEILGEKYKKDSPDSEEEIWIPIKPKL